MQPASTREQIFSLLRTGGPMTAARLSRHLGIGITAVRQHLERLRAEGWVEVVGLQRGRGRPGQLFSLTSEADRLFPQGYEALALDLLEAVLRLPQGQTLLRRLLVARRRLWLERYGPRLAGRPLAERLDRVTEVFNERGGLAHYAAQADGSYLLTKYHCNISTVASRYPIFCQEERAWLQEALEAQVEVVGLRSTGGRFCQFRIVPGLAGAASARPGGGG
jgi:predicted ArsR family transcriptional regulator